MRQISGITLALGLLAGPLLARDDDKKGVEKLVGTWMLISMDNGKGVREVEGFKFIISDKSIEMHSPDGATKKMGEIIRLDVSGTPATIDLKNNERTGLGIFELKGDDLRLIVRDPSQGRAREFKGTPQGILFVLKREKQ